MAAAPVVVPGVQYRGKLGQIEAAALRRQGEPLEVWEIQITAPAAVPFPAAAAHCQLREQQPGPGFALLRAGRAQIFDLQEIGQDTGVFGLPDVKVTCLWIDTVKSFLEPRAPPLPTASYVAHCSLRVVAATSVSEQRAT